MLNASLCDYSDVHILVEGRATVVGQRTNAGAIAADVNIKEIVLKKLCTIY